MFIENSFQQKNNLLRVIVILARFFFIINYKQRRLSSLIIETTVTENVFLSVLWAVWYLIFNCIITDRTKRGNTCHNTTHI